MQTAQEIGTFQRRPAEVPHGWVAIAPTGVRVEGSVAATTVEDSEIDSLVGMAKMGDRAALDQLVGTLRPRALAAAMKVLRNSDDAEDAVQEAFVKIWKSLARFEGRSSFSTWAFRIVTNASLDLLRRNGNSHECHAFTDVEPEAAVEVEDRSERTPESDLAEHELQSLVRGAIAALPGLHRQAVELRELEDCSYQEMAEIIRCPIGTVMSRLHHARHRLAADLRQPFADTFARAAA
jgi:RNA polymerase sigma-70 factor, ECF subfamily